METTVELPKLSADKITRIIKDPVKTAKAVNLVYVNDGAQSGITRKRKGKKWQYFYDGKLVKSEEEVSRINKLVIPPAWENVWICALSNGHLQATGIDALNRKQYKYHSAWNALRNHTKFFRMIQFGNVLPAIRLQLEKDLSLPGMQQRKVLAAVVSLMERTNIRIGNNVYEKLYGSFGITTLKDSHVKITGGSVKFSFKGKKGVMHNITLKSKKLARIVQQCKDIPGKELFQYIDDEGTRNSIDSGMVNSYIKEISGEDFSAKDFRTWSGTIHAFMAFKTMEEPSSDTARKKNVVAALDAVAHHLGNTRTVCKKYYIHPQVLNLYETDSLKKYLDELDKIEEDDGKSGLTKEEKIVLKMLEGGK